MTGQKISIAQLRPTQMTLGLDEVASRAAKIAAMGPADLEALLKKKPIPYVLGPGKQIYIVDHHHLARALWSLKIPEAILGDQLADWSDRRHCASITERGALPVGQDSRMSRSWWGVLGG